MKKGLNKTAKVLSTALIYALTASMLILAGIYINMFQNTQSGHRIPWEKRRVLENSGIVSVAANGYANYADPILIGITYSGKRVCAAYDDSLTGEIYKQYADIIATLFSPDARVKTVISAEASKIWDECFKAQYSLYLKYPGELIYPAIFALLRPDADISDYAGDIAYVQEMFIIPNDAADGEEGYFGVSRDKSGRITLYYPPEEFSRAFNSWALSAYNDIAGILSFDFLNGRSMNEIQGLYANEITLLELPQSYPVLEDFTYVPVLTASNPVSDSKVIFGILRLLRYNTDNAQYYQDNSGSLTFVESHGNLRLEINGNMTYTASGEGVHLSRFLGYDSDSYTFYEKLKTACIFTSSVNPEIRGNGCGLRITEISSDSAGSLNILFEYFYDGIRVTTAGYDGIFIKITDNYITEVKISAVTLNSGEKLRNLNPILVLASLEKEYKAMLQQKMFEESLNTAQKDGQLESSAASDQPVELLYIEDVELCYVMDGEGNITAKWLVVLP